MDSVDIEAVVIGAGVVGLACARRLSASGLSTIVLDAESTFGQGASSRNSEVIHAGIYYKPGSLKAKLCIKGRDLLYEYCISRNINHSQIGKWIVASNTKQVAQLEEIAKVARRNGCHEVYWLSGCEAKENEPELLAEKVLVSPRTGIIDSHGYMLSLLSDIEEKGGVFVPNTRVMSGSAMSNEIKLLVDGSVTCEIKARLVVNATGIVAPLLARKFGCKNVPEMPSQGFAKGNYFKLSGKAPFKRLVYPIPEQGGLGVHLTLDLKGKARFGPDVDWVTQLNYSVDPNRKKLFEREIIKYWPNFDPNRLEPDYAGIRAKIKSDSGFSDFIISSPKDGGIKGLVNLFGIESPGLTSSLAIAEEVAKIFNLDN